MKAIIILFVIITFQKIDSLKPVEDYGIDTGGEMCVEIQTKFCEGWDEGYCEGWEYVMGRFSRCPIIPRCPRPEIFQNEYNDGYNRGFVKGKEDAIEYQ